MKIPIAPILQGMGVTLSNFFSKPVTVSYPEEKRPVADRFRGRIYLKLETCIGCTLCEQACPVEGCIDSQPYKMHFINLDTCTRCDACLVACPVDAIKVGSR